MTDADAFVRFADKVMDLKGEVPAYSETCMCGGSVEVGKDVPAAERRRIREAFHGRHQRCIRDGESQ